MKRYYVAKMNKTIGFVLTLMVATICGSLYALYIQKDNYDILITINSCLIVKGIDLNHFEVFKNSFFIYLKQLGVVWIATLNSFTIPIVFIIFFAIVFSYSFTASCLIMIYGIQGILLSIKLFGVQAAVIILLIIYVGSNNTIFTNGLKKDNKTSNITNIVIILVVISAISLLDEYVFLFI